MAITKSAKKAIRSAARKRVFNLRSKDSVHSAEKAVRQLVREGKIAEAKDALVNAYKAFDKAAKTKFIKKNTASRMKSRLAKSVSKASKK